eukprot:TRINITY_DN13969_c0_g1_i1.p1 TRINITY_DN13969_c0_g1~~TRINITY_DN13969_c0_g1_i1.p1  ORF type:complete len:347 (-),score=47.31 TRINITY_DN13969_c0_g1_i1:161-1201(-)
MGATLGDQQWLLWSLLAMISWATSRFLLIAIGEYLREDSETAFDATVSAVLVVWMVAGGTATHSVGMSGHKALWQDIKGIRNTLCIVLACLIEAAVMIGAAIVLGSQPSSSAPMATMLPFDALVVSALAYFSLNESLGLQQMIGTSLACLGAACMAAADIDQSRWLWRDFVLGLLIFFAYAGSYFLRKDVAERGATLHSIMTFYLAVMGCLGVLGFCGCTLSGRGLSGFGSGTLFAFAVVSGALWVLGEIFFQHALLGKAGPALAIANTNIVLYWLLQLLFFQPSTGLAKLAGGSLCIVGVVVLWRGTQQDATAAPWGRSSSRSLDSVIINVSLQGQQDTTSNSEA